MGAEPIHCSIEELGSDHDRATFSCGHESLDNFLRQFASQNQKTGVSRMFVALTPGERIVRGHYLLAGGSVKSQTWTKHSANA